MSDQTNDNNDDNNEQPKFKIEFAEGCFDDFDGTQEELDELISQLTTMAASGELWEKSTPVEDSALVDQLDAVVDAGTEYGYDDDGYVKYPFAGNTRH